MGWGKEWVQRTGNLRDQGLLARKVSWQLILQPSSEGGIVFGLKEREMVQEELAGSEEAGAELKQGMRRQVLKLRNEG